MNLGLIPDIAKSLMLARWKQTLIAAVGVTFSISMFVTLLGFMNGLNGLLDGLILNRTAHVRLFNEIKVREIQPVDQSDAYKDYYNIVRSVRPSGERVEIHNVSAILNALHSDDRVRGVAPRVSAQVIYNVGNIELTGIINGIDVNEEARLYFFEDYVTTGDFTDLRNIPNSIILGKGAADKMLAKIGDIIQVTTPTGNKFSLKVVGYFQSGLADLDKVQSYTSIATTQKLLGKSNSYISDLMVKLNDMTIAPDLAKEYARLFNTEAEDIQTANAQFETGSNIRTLISYAVGITLLIVAGFGIYNILNMMIYEKMDTIAILKATGFSGPDVRNIFIFIALSIGISGGLTGLGIGFLLSSIIDRIPFVTAALPTITTFPVDYNPQYYIIGITFAVVTTFFAGWFPAKKASKVDPVIIIRGK
ncbi:MAG: ABC transporter permease [Saprospiraceae bacterium]|nr:ABC transporter permease [Saprospiraceae bacterium]